MKDIIQFSHANGFPGSTYKTFFSYLEDEFEIQYIDTVGHKAHYPITDNWETLADELVDELSQSQNKPVIGMGHSDYPRWQKRAAGHFLGIRSRGGGLF